MELLRHDGLGQEIIHAGFQTTLLIRFHSVCGQGNDGHAPAREFLKDVGDRLSEIRSCLHARESTELQASAHKFKGAVCIFAAHKVITITGRLEELALANEWEQAGRALAELEKHLDRLLPELTELAGKKAA